MSLGVVTDTCTRRKMVIGRNDPKPPLLYHQLANLYSDTLRYFVPLPWCGGATKHRWIYVFYILPKSPFGLDVATTGAGDGGKPGHITSPRNMPVKPLHLVSNSQTTYITTDVSISD